MIAFELLCEALRRVKSRREAENELRQLDEIGEHARRGESPVHYGAGDATAVAVAVVHERDATSDVDADQAVFGVVTVPGTAASPDSSNSPMAIDTMPNRLSGTMAVDLDDDYLVGEREVEVGHSDVIDEEEVEGP